MSLPGTAAGEGQPGSAADALSVRAAAEEAGEDTALVVEGEPWSFTRLSHRVTDVVGWLRTRLGDSPPGTRLALAADRRFESLLIAYACFELGWTLVPLHARWSEAEKKRSVEDLGIEGWITPADLPRSPGGAKRDPEPKELRPISDRDLLAVVPTSGSSGRAKGVALTYGAFLAAARASASRLGWRRQDRWLLSLPLAHIGGLSILTRCLIARRAAVLPPSGEGFDAATILERIQRDRVSLLSVVPLMLRRLLDSGHPPPPSLRLVLVGGAPLPPAWLRQAREAGWPALATYGLTEACSQVATQDPSELGQDPPRSGAPLLEGLEARLDGEGVLSLRGPALMRGYLPADASSGLDADGWLRTGDIARLEGNRLHILGRHDLMILTGGENVHPAEIERALLEMPEIAAACVVGVADEKWGQSVAAAIVPSSGAEPDEIERLKSKLSAHLAGFKRPRRWRVVDALPTNATGKVDRAAVRRLFTQDG